MDSLAQGYDVQPEPLTRTLPISPKGAFAACASVIYKNSPSYTTTLQKIFAPTLRAGWRLDLLVF